MVQLNLGENKVPMKLTKASKASLDSSPHEQQESDGQTT